MMIMMMMMNKGDEPRSSVLLRQPIAELERLETKPNESAVMRPFENGAM